MYFVTAMPSALSEMLLDDDRTAPLHWLSKCILQDKLIVFSISPL